MEFKIQKYVFAVHGAPKLETPEAGKEHMQKWRNWIADLGDAVIDPGLPLGKSKTVDAAGVANDGGSNPLSGITIVQAGSFDDALDMASSCPPVIGGGTIEVAPALEINM